MVQGLEHTLPPQSTNTQDASRAFRTLWSQRRVERLTVWFGVGWLAVTQRCSEQCKCQGLKRVEVHCKLEARAEKRRKRSREERRGRAGR